MKHTKTPSSKPKKRRDYRLALKNFALNCLYAIIFCVVLYLAVYLCAFVTAFIMRLILGDQVTAPVWTFVYQAISYSLAVTLILVFPKLWRKITQNTLQKNPEYQKFQTRFQRFLPLDTPNRDQLGLTGLPTWTDIGLAPIALVISLIAGAILLSVVGNIFPSFNMTQAQEIGYATSIFGFNRLLAFCALCVIAPIAEEILFRGWLYGKLRLRLGAIFASIICAAFFGIVHGQANVAIAVGVMGFAACFLREITGTIYSGILLHILKNTVAFLLLFIAGF